MQINVFIATLTITSFIYCAFVRYNFVDNFVSPKSSIFAFKTAKVMLE